LLHFTKFKFAKIKYIILFFSIFIIFGPLLNLFYAENPWQFIGSSGKVEIFNLNVFLKEFINDFIISFKFIYLVEKNIIFLIFFLPFLILNKNFQLKKEFLIIFFLIFEPIILFSLSENIIPQVRYFAGINSVVLILIAIVFNEFIKLNYKYFIVIFLIFNFYVIVNNIQKYNEINNMLSKNHSFLNFNKNIEVRHSKVFYLVDLSFQESLNQNKYYIKLYDNDLIKKDNSSKKFYNHIKQKIKKIQNTNEILINDLNLKEDLIYFNYSINKIENLKSFFEFVKKDFDYVVIEESRPFHLHDAHTQKKIKSYIKENYILKKIFFNKEKIYLKSQQDVISYYANTLTHYNYVENIDNKDLEPVFGVNYGLYKLK